MLLAVLQFIPLQPVPTGTMAFWDLIGSLLRTLVLASFPVIAFQLWRLASVDRRRAGRDHLSQLRQDPWLRVAQQHVRQSNGPLCVPPDLVDTFGSHSLPFQQTELLGRHRPQFPPHQDTHVEALENEALERLFLWLDEAEALLQEKAVTKNQLYALLNLLHPIVQPPTVEDPHAKPWIKYLRYTQHGGTLRLLNTFGLCGFEESKLVPA